MTVATVAFIFVAMKKAMTITIVAFFSVLLQQRKWQQQLVVTFYCGFIAAMKAVIAFLLFFIAVKKAMAVIAIMFFSIAIRK